MSPGFYINLEPGLRYIFYLYIPLYHSGINTVLSLLFFLMVQNAINGCKNRHWRSFHCCFVQNKVVSEDNSHVLLLYFDIMADCVITAAVFTCENYKSSIPAVATAVSDLPPRIGSGPWFVKSRPYRLSPSRIFCRH